MSSSRGWSDAELASACAASCLTFLSMLVRLKARAMTSPVLSCTNTQPTGTSSYCSKARVAC